MTRLLHPFKVFFAGFPQIAKAVLYGSRTKDNYRNGSDIDLTLVAEEGQVLGLDELYGSDEALDELLLPYSFDFSVLSQIDNEQLVEHIRRVCRLPIGWKRRLAVCRLLSVMRVMLFSWRRRLKTVLPSLLTWRSLAILT